MKNITLLFIFMLMTWALHAQYPVVTIQQVQQVSAADLMACNDSSSLLGDTVIVRGVVVTDGKAAGTNKSLSQAQGDDSQNIWIKDSTGAFSGLDVFGPRVSANNLGIQNFLMGDSIEIEGVIAVYRSETEIVPLKATLKGTASQAIAPIAVSVGDLNDNMQVNKVVTGEQYEGVYVEFHDVTVSAVSFFSSNTRVSFSVQDANGNTINVSDRFLVQRLPANGGTFTAPTVGTRYDTLRGLILHSGNGCLGTGRGYELHPFDDSDYVLRAGTSAPLISNIVRDQQVPTGMQDLRVQATIQDVDGTVTGAELKYAVGTGNFITAAMNNVSGNTWEGIIPMSAFGDGDLVKYYLCATDNDMLTACQPNVPNMRDPLFFTARASGQLSIYDVQFTPYTNGNSPYAGQTVSLTGIVTASAEPGNLGTVFMQDPNNIRWAGIQLTGNQALANLKVGEEVSVTGDVIENFGYTILSNITIVNVISSGHTIVPIEVNPMDFSMYDFSLNEPYEGMLVALKNPTAGQKVFVVDVNADAPNNFGEYRIGLDPFSPNDGCRVLAGEKYRQCPRLA